MQYNLKNTEEHTQQNKYKQKKILHKFINIQLTIEFEKLQQISMHYKNNLDVSCQNKSVLNIALEYWAGTE